jgi:hypothetical protein
MGGLRAERGGCWKAEGQRERERRRQSQDKVTREIWERCSAGGTCTVAVSWSIGHSQLLANCCVPRQMRETRSAVPGSVMYSI